MHARILFGIIDDFFSGIPQSTPPRQSADLLLSRAKSRINRASLRAASLSAGLSLPAGPLGLITIIPDLVGIWKLQRDLVLDIAALCGVQAEVSRDQMLRCLLRHSASQVSRDVLVKMAARAAVERSAAAALGGLLRRLGLSLASRGAGRLAPRAIPVLGSIAAGIFAFADTKRVGEAALELFAGNSTIGKRRPWRPRLPWKIRRTSCQ
jgi:hypothetical protein